METYGFQDIIRKSFLENNAFQQVSLTVLLIGTLVSIILGMTIYLVYKFAGSGVVYSKNFHISLPIICVITAIMIMTISSNVALSLGMVGALSIVRFRAAIKDPLDIVYIFWAITVGIASGAQLYPIAALGTIVVGALLLLLLRSRSKKDIYIMIIKSNTEAQFGIFDILKRNKYQVKSKFISKGNIELTIEINIKGNSVFLLNQLSSVEGVENVMLVNYKGDYATM